MSLGPRSIGLQVYRLGLMMRSAISSMLESKFIFITIKQLQLYPGVIDYRSKLMHKISQLLFCLYFFKQMGLCASQKKPKSYQNYHPKVPNQPIYQEQPHNLIDYQAHPANQMENPKSSKTIAINKNIEQKIRTTFESLNFEFQSELGTIEKRGHEKQEAIQYMDGFYQGEWDQLKPEGVGKYFSQQEESLIIAKFIGGQMVRDKCIKINKNGDLYCGALDDNNQMIGNGVLKGEGFSYKGEFQDDLMHGFGEYSAGTNSFKGIFRRGKKVSGREQNQNWEYEGAYLDGLKHGQGVIIWKNGGRFEGEFAKGMKNGLGCLYDAEGQIVRKGHWVEDEMVGNYQESKQIQIL